MSDEKKPEQSALDLLEASCNIEFYIGRKNANLIRKAVGKETIAEEKKEGEGVVARAVKAAAKAEVKELPKETATSPAVEAKKAAKAAPKQGLKSKDAAE